MAESRSRTKGWAGMKMPAGAETACNIVLSVSPNDEDSVSLEGILDARWTVIARTDVASALPVLREISTPIPVVTCDCDISSGTWKEMLDHISLFPEPPLLIVTSRLADERLWAEALNLGAWDVLAKPFDADEVMRVVSIAGQHWQYRHGVYMSRGKQRKSANGTGHLVATGT